MHGKADPQLTESTVRTGLIQGVGAYLIWGLLPLYFGLLAHVGAFEIVANRIVWSVLLLVALVPLAGRLGKLRAAFANRRAVGMLAVSAVLIAVNWLVYVWSVLHQHVLATSLGYFLNPLVNVLLGTLLLKERLDRVQAAAVGLAAVGVAVLAAEAPGGLWISLTLAVTFAFYGYVRKLAPVEPIEGLTIETLLLGAPSLAYLLWLTGQGGLAFGQQAGTSTLLVLSGPLTAVPLLLFAAAARRLQLTTLGLMQYLAPSLQFLLAVTLFREPLGMAQWLCFGFIWTGLILFAGHSVRLAHRRSRMVAR